MLGDLLEAGQAEHYMALGQRYLEGDRRVGDILQWMAAPDYQVRWAAPATFATDIP